MLSYIKPAKKAVIAYSQVDSVLAMSMELVKITDKFKAFRTFHQG